MTLILVEAEAGEFEAFWSIAGFRQSRIPSEPLFKTKQNTRGFIACKMLGTRITICNYIMRYDKDEKSPKNHVHIGQRKMYTGF